MLPALSPDPNALVNVQQTAFSHDVLGRWVCSTFPEVSNNGGDPFDIVVIGAGMFGGYIADKLYPDVDPIGKEIKIAGIQHRIIGVLKKRAGVFGGDPNRVM